MMVNLEKLLAELQSHLLVIKNIFVHPFESRQIGIANISSVIAGNPSTVSASAKGTTLSARSSDHNIEAKAEIANSKSSDSRVSTGKDDGTETSDVHKQSSSRSIHSPGQDNLVAKSSDKPQKRTSPADELDRLNKRRKGEIDLRDMDGGEVRFSEKERLIDARGTDKLHPADFDKPGSDELNISRVTDKLADRSKDKTNERYDRDYRERLERPEKSRGDDILSEKLRDRSLERHGRERSVERVQEKGADRNFDRLGKDDRNKNDGSKVPQNEGSVEKSHIIDRFHGQSLPPPPALLPHDTLSVKVSPCILF